MSATEAKSWWQRKIAKDYRALVFCIFEGLALALPVGIFVIPEAAREAIPAPDWLRLYTLWVCVGAVILLPVWSVALFRSHPLLLWLGLLTFLALGLLLASPRT